MKKIPQFFGIVLFLTLLLNLNIIAQTPAPAFEWKKETWSKTVNGLNIWNESGENWWFSHKNLFNTSNQQIGYIACGYTGFLFDNNPSDENLIRNIFNEGINSCVNPYPATGPIGAAYGVCQPTEFAPANKALSSVRGNVARLDLNGNMLWCVPLTFGDINEVIVVGNFIYAIGTHSGARNMAKSSFLKYNPDASNPNNTFDLSDPSFSGGCGSPLLGAKTYVAKVDLNGNVIWENLYGELDYNVNSTSAWESGGYGSDMILHSNGDLYCTSFHTYLSGGNPFLQGLVLRINPSNGYLVNKSLLPYPSITNTFGQTYKWTIPQTIAEIGTTGNMAVGCKGTFNYSQIGPDEYRALVYSLNPALGLNTTWATNPIDFPPLSPPTPTNKQNSNILDINYHFVGNQLLLGVMRECEFCFSAGDQRGKGEVHRLNNFGNTLGIFGNNPLLLGPINAFDLRVGVTETSGGGIAAVSSRNNIGAIPAPTAAEYGTYGCLSTAQGYWDTDPLIVKFDANGNKKWEWSEDLLPGRARQTPLGDIKRQECMYKITEAQDGGFVISGNSSHDNDDNYMVKLYSDCNAQQPYTITDPSNIIYISTNTTWNTSQKVLGSVHIVAGGILNITGNNTVIEFADSKLTGITTNIVVEVGGQLNVTDAALISISNAVCPGSMWDGIIVEGTSGVQKPATQGYCTFNGGGVYNARTAVQVGDITNKLSSVNGGVVKAFNFAKFVNNNIDFQFFTYHAPLNNLNNEPDNVSFIEQCVLLGDNYLNDPSYTNANGQRLTTKIHIDLLGVKNIRITANDIRTDLTTLGSNYPTNNRSIGINSLDASFIANSICTVPGSGPNNCGFIAPNTFNGLRYGIFHEAANQVTNPFTVDRNHFLNCYSSVYQNNSNFTTLTNNIFEINTTLPPAIGTKACALNPLNCGNYFYYVNNSSGFSHQENTYKVSGSQNVVGTVFNNVGSGANESYRNSYSGLYAGTQNQLNNGTANSFGGLQIKCNTNTSTKNVDLLQTSGALGQQGICLSPVTPANNSFSHFSAGSSSDIRSSFGASSFQYNYISQPANGIQDPIYLNVPKFPCVVAGGFDYLSHCPTNFACGIPCQRVLVVSNQTTAIVKQAPLLAGNAPLLYNSISNNTISPGDLKNILMQYSPFLSDGVLLAYLQKAQTPPAGNIKQIIIANSPVTDPVKTALLNLNLPNGIQSQIDAVQTGVSPRKQLEDEVNYYLQESHYAINNLVRLLLNDTTVPYANEEILKWLEYSRSLDHKVSLAQAEVTKGDYARAQTLIDSLNAMPAMGDVVTVLQTGKNLKQQNKNWTELKTNTAMKNTFMVIANDSLSAASGFARAALKYAMDIDSYDVVEAENTGNNNNRFLNNTNPLFNEVAAEGEIGLSAYPNPFNNELNVSYKLLNEESEGLLTIVEMGSGRIMIQQTLKQNKGLLKFNAVNLNAGMYLISITQKNFPSKYIKLVNIK